MMKRIIFSALLALLVGQVVQAQQPARETAPPDPQLAPLPDKIAFVKTFAYPAVPPNPSLTEEQKKVQQFIARIHPQLDRLEIVKTAEIRREMQHYTNGTVLEIWKSGEITFSVDSTNPGLISVSSPSMTAHPEDAASAQGGGDFAELSWVNSGNFRGEEVRQGIKCFVYKAGDRAAWLDEPTRLPVFFQSAKMQVAYTYKSAPAESLQLPDKFTKKLERVKRAWMGRAD